MIPEHKHVDLGISDTDDQRCPFCHFEPARIFASNEHAVVVFDGFLVNPGHVLIISKRHIVSTFEAAEEEWAVNLDLPG
ncbi:MAG: hypothetical protein VB050_12705 [Geobacteraceae bacterium]|nr:hypothetical protein [Geobacteraceae bacterium]